MQKQGWSDILADELKNLRLPTLRGDHIVVASDYSGDDQTTWWTAAFLILDVSCGPDPADILAQFSSKHTGVRDYKRLRKPVDIRTASNFLEQVEKLHGHMFVFGSRSKLRNLSLDSEAARKLKSRGDFQHEWNDKALERMSRICHVLARYLECFALSSATVNWFTDNDQICDSVDRKDDLISTINSFRCLYSGLEYGRVQVASSAEPEHTELAHLLCKAPDHVAGAFKEKLQNGVIEGAQRGSTNRRSLTPSRRAERLNAIDQWLGQESATMPKIQFAIDEDEQGLRMHRILSETR